MYRYRVEYLKDERNYPTLMREHSEIVEGLMTKDKMCIRDSVCGIRKYQTGIGKL